MSTYFRFISFVVCCSTIQVLSLGSAAIAQFADAEAGQPLTSQTDDASQWQDEIAQKIAHAVEYASDGGYVPPDNGGPDYSQGSGTR